VVGLAKACADNGADAVSLINTITGMSIDVRTRRPKLATIFGGLSGPAIKPIALRMVYQVHRAGLGIQICGIGGIQNGMDAIEFLLAGASTIQVGTQNFVDPGSAEKVVQEIEEFCRENDINDVKELVGALKS
jgi:dihydroorotate dehydrogenase (NAD+) catalytic subunit